MIISRFSWAAACLMWAACIPTLAAAADWNQVRTTDFRVISAVGSRQTRRIVEDVELFQAAVGKILKEQSVHPNVPATMFLLDDRLWNRYVPLPKGKAGVVYVYPSAIYVVVNADTWISAAPVVYHELTHVVFRQNARGLRLPVWYNEGYADFFSTIRKQRGTVELGLAPWWRWLDLKNLPWMSLQQVMTVSTDSPEYQKERLASAFYAASWLIIHYAVFENPHRGRQIEHYRLLLSRGFDHKSAFAEAFAGDQDEFENELKAYAKQTTFKYYTLKLPELAPAKDHVLVRLPEREAMDALAGWLLTARYTNDEQLKLASKLAAGTPPDSVAAMQLAAFHALRGERTQAQALAEKGCVQPLSDLRVAMLCGDVYLGIAGSTDLDLTAEQRAALAEDARRYYGIVLSADPDNVEGLLSMSYTTEFAPLADDQVREGLQRLWQRSIRNSEIAYAIATLYASQDLAKSKEYLEQAMLLAEDREIEQRVLSVLQQVEAEMANRHQ